MPPSFLNISASSVPDAAGSNSLASANPMASNSTNNNNNGIALASEDVIVGKGKGAYLSEGNRRYMQIVCQYVTRYRNAGKNADKVQITKEIVDQVTRKGGRFLGIDARGKLYEVTDKQARVKVGQALRHKIRQNDGTATSERSTMASERTSRTSVRGSERGGGLGNSLTSERVSMTSDRFTSERSIGKQQARQQQFQQQQQQQHRKVSERSNGAATSDLYAGSYRDSASSFRSVEPVVSHRSVEPSPLPGGNNSTASLAAAPALNMPNNASLSNNANHQMFFAAAAAGGLEFSPQVPASSNELNPYVPHKGVAASSALNVGTSSSISMDGVVGNFQYLHVAGDEFEPLGPADAHQEADEFAPFSPIAVTQPYVTVPAAKAKKSGLSLSATQALQIPTAEELIAAGGLGGIKDTMSEFSNLSLTESDRLDLGNMSD